MSILVIQISPRRRLRASGSLGSSSEGARLTEEFVYALSPDGLLLESHGQCAAALLPKAETIVAVLADADVSWHRITLPKAPAARMRTALVGVLEEHVLEDADQMHFAVAPEATPGQPTWIAAMDHGWLRAELAALEKANVFVDRVVPNAWPDDPPGGHFAETESHDNGGSEDGISLTWSHPDGVACLRLHGGLARTLVPAPTPHGMRWSATPGAAAAAERWLGTPVNVMPPAQRLLQAARTLWNLRQFTLARRNRGTRALRDSWKQFLSPAWRPVRVGLAALVIAQIVGINLWSWNLKAAINAKREAAIGIVKSTFPRVPENSIRLDPGLVMQRETDLLRLRAGRPGDTDFEPMLQAAAAAWPADQPPVENMKYENGKLTLATVGWKEPQLEQFKSRLRPLGWKAESTNDGRVTLSRSPAGAAS